MLIRSINTGSDLGSIIKGSPNGKDVKYFILEEPRKDLERISYLANKKIDNGCEVFIKVKFEWEYGQRARVLEVVSKSGKSITISKFVSVSNFDKHLFDLERIREVIEKQFGISSDNIICSLVTNSESEANQLKKLIANMGKNFIIENL